MTTVQPFTAPDVKTTLADAKSPIADVKNGLPFEEIEPHSSPVNLGTLLNEMSEAILRHIVCEKETAYASTLWIAMTYLVHLFDVIALLIVTAPEMRCGKSEFRRLIGKMVLRPLEADNMSAAVLFRSFDLWHPTLLVDEYDSFVKNNEELRGVFNAGHQRGGCVWRCEGEKFTPKAFDVFGPKVLAGIGRLPSLLIEESSCNSVENYQPKLLCASVMFLLAISGKFNPSLRVWRSTVQSTFLLPSLLRKV